MVWTKATFWLVADTLKAELARQITDETHGIYDREGYETIQRLATEFADAFAKSNDRFDHAKFIKACGLEV